LRKGRKGRPVGRRFLDKGKKKELRSLPTSKKKKRETKGLAPSEREATFPRKNALQDALGKKGRRGNKAHGAALLKKKKRTPRTSSKGGERAMGFSTGEEKRGKKGRVHFYLPREGKEKKGRVFSTKKEKIKKKKPTTRGSRISAPGKKKEKRT